MLGPKSMGFIYHFPQPFGIPHFQTYQYCTVRTDISDIVAAEAAFAALRTDGTVIAWGNPHFGGSVWVPKMSQSVDLVGWHIYIFIYIIYIYIVYVCFLFARWFVKIFLEYTLDSSFAVKCTSENEKENRNEMCKSAWLNCKPDV